MSRIPRSRTRSTSRRAAASRLYITAVREFLRASNLSRFLATRGRPRAAIQQEARALHLSDRALRIARAGKLLTAAEDRAWRALGKGGAR